MEQGFKFDYSKLKRRPSYPFENIAVAISFSGRLEALLCEARRLSISLGASLFLIHIGVKTSEKEEQLDQLMQRAGLNRDKVRVIWMDGDPVDLILKICKLNIVDLLILGALEKENLFKYYVGSIARNISRRAKTSVLLMPHPHVDPKPFRKIVVNGVDNPKTIHSLRTAMYLAHHDHAAEVAVILEGNMPTLTMTMAENATAPEAVKIKKELMEDEHQKLQAMVESLDKKGVEVGVKTVSGKPGYAIGNYARNKNADLLVFNSPDTHLGIFDRIFTHGIEYVLADIPCNLLIVHSRVEKN